MADSVKDFPLDAKLCPYENVIVLYIVKVFLISYLNFLLQEGARRHLLC
jgi:hypothetical protein